MNGMQVINCFDLVELIRIDTIIDMQSCMESVRMLFDA